MSQFQLGEAPALFEAGAGAAVAKPGARIIAVRALTGSAGRSVVAANLAFELASSGSRVCLIDLDDNWPSLHRYFGLPKQQAAVLAAMRLLSQDKLDSNALEDLSVRLVAKGVGVDFLSGFGLGGDSAEMVATQLVPLLQALQQRFDFLVLDTPISRRSEVNLALASLERRDIVVVLADPINLGRLVDARNSNQFDAEALLVLNRLRASVLGARPEWQIQQLLRDNSNFRQAAVIPEDPAFDEAMLRGLPLRQVSAKAKALQAIAELAGRLA